MGAGGDVGRVSPAAATIAYYHEAEGGLKASFTSCPALGLQLGPLETVTQV